MNHPVWTVKSADTGATIIDANDEIANNIAKVRELRVWLAETQNKRPWNLGLFLIPDVQRLASELAEDIGDVSMSSPAGGQVASGGLLTQAAGRIVSYLYSCSTV